MNTVVKTKFAVKPVVAAVALAVSAGGALADPNNNALPGAGRILATNLGTTFSAINYTVTGGGAAGGNIQDATANVATISINNPGVGVNVYGVIQWGGISGYVDATNPNGFNIGKTAKLTFTDNALLNSVAILNVDASKNPSQIFGQLEVVKGAGTVTNRLFVSNANGIYVGPNGAISAPDGIGLIGADLSGNTSVQDFIAANTQNLSYIDYASGLGNKIWIQKGGSVTGSLIANVPATFILLAGGNILNEGNLYANQIDASAGMIAAPGKSTVNLIANTVVNRLFSVDGLAAAGWPTFGGFSTVDGNLGTANPNIAVGDATSTFVNLGAVTSKNGGFVGVSSAGGIRNGTVGDANLLVGIFSDNPVVLNTFGSTAVTELYNVVGGYTTNPILPFLNINQSTKASGDVVINALTPASQPSSITTTGPINIFGGNITIASTVNDKLAPTGKQNDVDLNVFATKSLTISGNIGAGRHVNLYSYGPINISGNVTSDTNKGGYGGIYIYNYGTVGPNTTTISGNLATASTSIHDIHVYHYGSPSGKLTITGTVTTATNNSGNVILYSRGQMDLGGAVSAGGNVILAAYGNSVLLRAPITADTGLTGSYFSLAAPFGTTKMYPAAVVTAPTVQLGYDGTLASTFGGTFSGVENIIGVNASGNAYASKAEKPAAQFVTDNVVGVLLGDLRAPIAGNTNWLLNDMHFTSMTPTTALAFSLSAVGGHQQNVNIGVTGDANVDSGLTITSFGAGFLSSGFLGGGVTIGNGGSQLIMNTSGDLGIVSSSGAQGASGPGGPGFATGGGGNANFTWPGGFAFKSATMVSQFLPIFNAWTTVAQPYQGGFFEAPILNLNSFFATNGNSWGNYSVLPQNGVPTIYQIQPILLPPNSVPIGFGFVINPTAAHFNTYSQVITGTPVNFCPIGLVC